MVFIPLFLVTLPCSCWLDERLISRQMGKEQICFVNMQITLLGGSESQDNTDLFLIQVVSVNSGLETKRTLEK